ncbi:uncharacterized protein LACBIDRAFT_317830 [Laccaria bicolor S238N-H82]|uniref:Predicted protein n=1 Tax=Laccaria bicolor (strain S238N-H82 / ATCC MYA-4686) TaxID=486041 RepID=B0D5C0_LACBS|nr:uncharacterized protein LACBIDRAFT_317830 [Laccaria bicolor S238N-H82]EDR09990.1 predicted protein [Laccaria bicolor S238N-H82]|eukprot:XP_001879375.1 predicted protein [Laccaria bicolor S238N-H82]
MAKFYDCPSLLIYNDSTFSEKDFEGICRTNVGGKKNRSDTIGQFGLGLAIIISRNDILFLNPSREHLPFKDRAALRMPLSHIREFYPDHLTALEGVFGFNMIDTGSFQGTIFMLPLRQSSHYEGFEHVSDEPWTPEMVRREILEDFESIAADCLLFTEIVSISASSRNRGGIREEWTLNAARESPLLEGKFRYRKLTISHLPATAHHNSRTWQIATQAVAIDTLSHDLSSVSKRQPMVGLAASSENKNEHSRGSHRFFSTLPLPVSTSLPVHVTASFVLSSDRRNIRLDEFDNLETKYNKWLLSTILPPLYLFLLAKLSCFGDNGHLWPGNTTDDSISRLVTSTFYSIHLKSSKLPVFRSEFHPFPVYPEQAVISGNELEAVSTALDLMKPHNIVKLSSPVRWRVIQDAGMSAVTPQYLRTQILSDPTILTSTLNVTALSNLVRFLVRDGVGAVVDLNILPLQDGTFGTFMPKLNNTSYYVWKKSYGTLIFPPNRIVSSEFDAEGLQILDVDLNIASLDSLNVSTLTREFLPESEEMTITTPPLLDWIKSFWATYFLLSMNEKDIELLPLVATMEAGHFVSLSYCRTNSVVLSNEAEPSSEWLWDLLQQLRILTVRKDHLPRALKGILEGKDYPTFNLSMLLSIMEPSISQIVEQIQSLDEQVQHQFASWFRHKLSSSELRPDLIDVARSLPIWPAACQNQPERLCAASQVLQLPSGLTLKVARFMRVLVSPELALKSLNVEPISFSDLHSVLDLPRVLVENDKRSYKALLRAWVNGLPASDVQPLQVPNCNLVMRLSNSLYARDPLFEAAFGPNSPSFVHSRFQDLEEHLYRHGLQRQSSLTMTVFAVCARALQRYPADADKTARAAVVFASYSEDLPLHVGSAQRHLWHTVDNIRFIPRKMNVAWELQYVQHLPEVVSPNELVREEFEHIAWTQRAFFNEQPDQRVLLAYPGLGKPTVSDVVMHLRILSKFSRSDTLLRDVTATYTFLNDNAEAARNVIIQHHDEKIFLNVDDTSRDEWTWEAADNLAFSTRDIEEVQRVRHFLTPFKNLLLSAGVVPVYHPPVGDASPSTSDSVLLLQIRTGFNEMRKARQFIDVVFVPSSGSQLGEGEIDLELVAHRNFLAVYSDYFRDAFCGDYKEALAASSSDPIRFPVDHSKPCIAAVLDYIYSGTFVVAGLPDEETSLGLDDLMDIMKLSGYWHLTGLFELVQREIATKGLIDPTTLTQTSEVASSIGATLLLDYCREYESHNSEYIRKVRG